MAVFVFVEHHEGDLSRSSLGVLGKAASLSDDVVAVLCGSGVRELASDVAAGLAARLDAGLNWDLVDIQRENRELVGKRSALQDTVLVDVGWKGEPRIGLIRSGTFEPVEEEGVARVEDVEVELQDFSTRAVMLEQAHAEDEG